MRSGFSGGESISKYLFTWRPPNTRIEVLPWVLHGYHMAIALEAGLQGQAQRVAT